jgi:hypothetical protein
VPSDSTYFHRAGRAREIYRQAHGDPIGESCFHCGETIEWDWSASQQDRERFPYGGAFTVHHVDYDEANNDPANLAPSHHRCNAGDLSPESRERIRRAVSARQRGASRSPEVKAMLREGWTPDRRDANAEKMRRQHEQGDLPARYRCAGCGMVTVAGSLAQHQARTGHEGRERVDA